MTALSGVAELAIDALRASFIAGYLVGAVVAGVLTWAVLT